MTSHTHVNFCACKTEKNFQKLLVTSWTMKKREKICLKQSLFARVREGIQWGYFYGTAVSGFGDENLRVGYKKGSADESKFLLDILLILIQIFLIFCSVLFEV